MITILASIAGFIGSIIPECLKFLQDKNDKKHEIEILKIQMQIKDKQHNNRLDEIIHFSDLAETKFFSNTYKNMLIR